MSDRTIRAVLTGSSAGAVRAFQETASAADTASKKTSTSFEESGNKVKGVFSSILGAGAALGGAFLGISAIKDVVVDATHAFGDQQTATVLLNQAMANTGQQWSPLLTSQFQATSEAMMKFGDDTATTEGAIQTLVLRGLPAGQAMADMGTLANLAAAKHMRLADATEAVTKAASGRMSPALKELGITLPKGVTGVAALNDIMGQITPKVEGSANAISHTMPGAMAVFHATITDKLMVPLGDFINKGLVVLSGWISDHATDISNILGGALSVVGTAFSVVATAVGWVTDHFNILGPVLAVVLGSFVAFKAAMAVSALFSAVSAGIGIATGAFALLTTGEASAATAADALAISELAALAPFIAIGIAIAAVVGGIILMVTHFQQIKAIVMPIWDAIGDKIGGVINVIGTILKTAFSVWVTIFTVEFNIIKGIVTVAWDIISTVIGIAVNALKLPIMILTQLFVLAFDAISWAVQHVLVPVIQGIVGVISGVVSVVGTVIGGITTAFSTVFGGLAAIVGAVAGPIGAAIRAVIGVAKGIIDGVISAINFVIGIIDAIQVHIHFGPVNMDWSGLQIPKIPALDVGGTIAETGIALVHKGEVVMNSSQQSAVMGSSRGGVGVYIENLTVLANDPGSLIEALKRYQNANGALPLTVNAATRLGAA